MNDQGCAVEVNRQLRPSSRTDQGCAVEVNRQLRPSSRTAHKMKYTEQTMQNMIGCFGVYVHKNTNISIGRQ